MNHVTEVVLFRLKSNTNEAAFIEDAKATFDLLQSYDGYIDRELSVSDDGLWVDVVTWQDIDTALNAAEEIMATEIGQTFGAHIDPESIQMTHIHPRISKSALA